MEERGLLVPLKTFRETLFRRNFSSAGRIRVHRQQIPPDHKDLAFDGLLIIVACFAFRLRSIYSSHSVPPRPALTHQAPDCGNIRAESDP